MGLVHPALLAGLALTAIPVILHLLLRARPKKLLFPALRLIQQRKRSNVRRMRLRHLWLLLLRMALLALLVLALARPRVPAADYSPSAFDWARLAALLLALAATHAVMLGLWRQRGLPAHEVAWRRSALRATLGVAGLAAFVLLVAWPYQKRIAASITQPVTRLDESLPVTAAFLFDTSLSMHYRHESRSRLELAQEIATRHLGSLARQSRVAVTDTSTDAAVRFQTDLTAAIKRVAALVPQPVGRPLDDRLLVAIEAHLDDQERAAEAAGAGATEPIREIYIFTDLAATGWRLTESPRLQEALDRMPGLGLYLIDVGVPSPNNTAITSIALSDSSVPVGTDVLIGVVVEGVGNGLGERTIELYAENTVGKLVRQGAPQTVRVEAGSAATAQFVVRAQAGPVMQGEVRLVSSDPMSFDDVRGFTIDVQPPGDVLIVADNGGDARYLIEALAPDELAAQGRARYRVRIIRPDQLASAPLDRTRVVCLVNVPGLPDESWKKLVDYVGTGGACAIILGDRVKHAAYLAPAAAALLPGELTAELAFDPPEYLDLERLTHPLLKKFSDWGAAALKAEPILRYWRVAPARDSAVIASYTDPRRGPALVERAIGKGRVLLLTTALDRRGWNDLPVAGWEFVALCDQMMRYLSRGSLVEWNYIAGQDVRVPLDPSLRIPAYLLRKPGLQQLRGDIPEGAAEIAIRDADQIGNYRLLAAETDAVFERGFSVNPDGAESNLTRLGKADLDTRLGAERYSIARDVENLKRIVQTGRQGLEVFPQLVLLLLVLFVLEHFVANRFYDAEQRPEAEPVAGSR